MAVRLFEDGPLTTAERQARRRARLAEMAASARTDAEAIQTAYEKAVDEHLAHLTRLKAMLEQSTSFNERQIRAAVKELAKVEKASQAAKAATENWRESQERALKVDYRRKEVC